MLDPHLHMAHQAAGASSKTLATPGKYANGFPTKRGKTKK